MSDIHFATNATELADILRRTLGAKSVLITETTQDGHTVHAHSGPELPEKLRRKMPVGYPVCEHTVAMGFPLVVDDAFNHPLLVSNPSVRELGIGSYAGAPLFRPDGTASGTVCAMQDHIYRWSTEQIEAILTSARYAEKLVFGVNTT